MVIDHADRLHERINGRWTDKTKAMAFQFFGKCSGYIAFGWDLSHVSACMDDRCAIDKAPDKCREILFFREPEVSPGVINGCLDLQAVTYNAGIAHQPLNVPLAEARDFFRIEALKHFSEVCAFLEDGEPRKAGLKGFEIDFFEQGARIGLWNAPFFVVVAGIFGGLDARPAAAYPASVVHAIPSRDLPVAISTLSQWG